MKVFDTRGRQWAQNNVENGPRLLIYVILNSWKRNFSLFLFQPRHTASFLNTVIYEPCIGLCHFVNHSKDILYKLLTLVHRFLISSRHKLYNDQVTLAWSTVKTCL